MPHYDLRPIEIDEDVPTTYELLRGDFIRPNNQLNIVADYVNDDSFSIDLVRSYSVIASTHRANIHVSGTPIEGGTRISFHVKSVETQEKLEQEVTDRIEEALKHIIAEKRDMPIEDENEPDPEKEKRQLIIVLAVAGVIAIGAGLTAILQQYSGFWLV